MFAEVLAGPLLDHGLVPYGGKPPAMYYLDTRTEAKNYAAGGFHVSVIRGKVGGCKDPAAGFASSGTDPGATCKQALDRDDLSVAWETAAEGYKAAYDAYVAGKAWQDIKAMLVKANALADVAYQQEGVDPPKFVPPPTPGSKTVATPDPFAGNKKPSRKLAYGLATAGAVGLIGLLGVIGLSGSGGKRSKRSSARSSQKTTLKRSRRR